MENNKFIIKSSFKGISGDFIRNVIILAINLFIFLICSALRSSIYSKYSIDSFISYVTSLDNILVVVELSVIYLVYIILVIVSFSTFIQSIGLFYEIKRTVIFDRNSNKIVVKSFYFPFNRSIDENKFNDIIGITISQNFFQRIFGTGNLCVEYIVNESSAPQIKYLEIPYTYLPFQQKNKLLQ
ncbi:PH domain-containing protein [Clostridium sp. 19966]|uniref:PH domain-containing protein n=1 Tax=Clostridium sp. 19966 TaxID=2768166 RepID=UPI0028DFB7D3|nr:PH domain-containing protein [Clostridium sp. 19966]MDT8716325.1 PH domain-containing protein [Clostridium sp. 19966]